MGNKAIGLLETYGYVGAVIALDTALKCSEVKLLSYELITGGIVTVTIAGDVSAVQSAEDAARVSVEAVGITITTHIIPRLSEEVEFVLYHKNNIKSSYKMEAIEEKKESENQDGNDNIVTTQSEDKISCSEESLNSMKVEELRTLARQVNIATIDRSKIKFSKKKELIEAIMLTSEGSENR